MLIIVISYIDDGCDILDICDNSGEKNSVRAHNLK